MLQESSTLFWKYTPLFLIFLLVGYKGGLKFPTSMAILATNDILVLEKNESTVMRIANGIMLAETLLDVNVATKGERGMLGIAIAKHGEKDGPTHTYVFLYFTEAVTKDGDDARQKTARYKISSF